MFLRHTKNLGLRRTSRIYGDNGLQTMKPEAVGFYSIFRRGRVELELAEKVFHKILSRFILQFLELF